MRESYTVETEKDVYNVNIDLCGMILTDSNGEYITSGFWNIVRFMLHEKILSFQKWDDKGTRVMNYVSLKKIRTMGIKYSL